MTENLRRIYI